MAETRVQTPRSFSLLLALTVIASIWLFVLSTRAYPPWISTQLILIVLVAAFSEFFAFEFPNFTVVLAYPLAMSAAMLGGPAASGIVAAVSAISVSDIRKRRPPAILAFNLFSLVLVSCLSGWAYVVLSGGRILATAPWTFSSLTYEDFPPVLYGMIGCAVVSAASNLLLTSFGIALYQGRSFRRILVSCVPIIPTQLTLPFVGFLMAQVLAIDVVALPLFIFPLVIARQFYQRSTALRAAYADTVRSLVGALEAKDPYTRGHSERVANYALALGCALNLDDATMQRLEYAALLHDLGKLAVPGAILTKPDALTQLEIAAIREHPTRGASMVARIPLLKDLADYVGGHHEWYGGGGYPNSISLAEIPQIARILAVADSYDAMTTTRAYRPALNHDDAITELESGAGSQFDPELVRVFVVHRIGLRQSDGARVEPTASPTVLTVPAG